MNVSLPMLEKPQNTYVGTHSIHTLLLADVLKIRLELHKDMGKYLKMVGIKISICESIPIIEEKLAVPLNKIGECCEGEDFLRTFIDTQSRHGLNLQQSLRNPQYHHGTIPKLIYRCVGIQNVEAWKRKDAPKTRKNVTTPTSYNYFQNPNQSHQYEDMSCLWWMYALMK